MLTPIYLQYQPGFLPLIPANPAPLAPSASSLSLGPAYYTLTIQPPHNPNQTGLLSTIYPIRIPASQEVRLQLSPTVGFGVNSAYEVTYTMYRDITSPLADYYPPQKKVIRTEHWRVPNLLGRFYANYAEIEDEVEQLDSAVESLSLVRGEETIDILEGEQRKAFAIQRIEQDGVVFEDYQITSEGIEWTSEVQPAEGSDYTVRYFKPFEMKEILYIPQRDDYTLIKTVKTPLENYSYIVKFK